MQCILSNLFCFVRRCEKCSENYGRLPQRMGEIQTHEVHQILSGSAESDQTEAQKSCQGQNADLASVQNSYEDIDFLLAYLKKATLTSSLPTEAWLGGMRLKSRWFWLDLSWFKSENYSFEEDEFAFSTGVLHPGVESNSEQEHRSWPVACMVLKSEPTDQLRIGPSGIIIRTNQRLGYNLNIRKCDAANSYFCQKTLEVKTTRVLVERSQSCEQSLLHETERRG